MHANVSVNVEFATRSVARDLVNYLRVVNTVCQNRCVRI